MINLKPEFLDTVKRILADQAPEFEVLVFGSRVLAEAKEFSDLDLVIMTARPLSLRRLARLREALSESNLPLKVDVVDWAATEESFRPIILNRAEVIQKGSSKAERAEDY